ncbi:MAG: AmmeMemoRadiSam system protein A [Chloroflexi bacterium]|nr:AmmeMemoRadiSam system protein A [Chloroflexota bacterium]MCL5274091.1 AmmeMemoRadiSam system protein A [Chloroflexota bacterium]
MSDMELSPTAREALLEVAYRAISDFVTYRHVSAAHPDDPQLLQRAGAFVTLMRQGELRGCIGHTQADMPLWQVVQQMAISAAENDPRFYPMTPDELDDLEIEISVLSPLQHISSIDEIEVGKHGLMITKGFHRGLLLPQVPTEYGWDRDTFLEALCEKAGLPPGSWRHGATLETFTALVFGKHFGSRAHAHHAKAMI